MVFEMLLATCSLFKGSSFLEVWWRFSKADRNHAQNKSSKLDPTDICYDRVILNYKLDPLNSMTNIFVWLGAEGEL